MFLTGFVAAAGSQVDSKVVLQQSVFLVNEMVVI